jgi:hypothetical protein
MVLREVFEPSTMVDFDGCAVRLIDQVFCDVRKVLRVNEHLVKVVVLIVYSID